jgi:hypothetical protein
MKKSNQISDDDIKRILNENLLYGYWELELGIKYAYEGAPEGVRWSKPYPKIGKMFWDRIKPEIHSFICSANQPREWVNDIITGDIRNLIIGLVSALTSKYDISIAIAIPIVALILKTGILNFCSSTIGIADKIDIKKVIDSKEVEHEVNKTK